MRAYELAKQLKISNKELMTSLEKAGVKLKNHFSALEEEHLTIAGRIFSDPAEEAEAKPKKAPGAKAKPKAEAEAAPVPEKAPAKKPAATKAKPASKATAKPKAKSAAPKAQAPKAKKAPAPKAEEAKPAEEAKTAPVEKVLKAKSADSKPKGEIRISTDEEEDGQKVITIRGSVTVRDFAEALGMRPNKLVAELMSMNVFATINQKVDIKMAQKIGEKHGVRVDQEKKVTEHKAAVAAAAAKATQTSDEQEEDRPEEMQIRPPVVTFLGHVDHGKTSLLDKIRRAAVAKDEDGGITQHIGAYTVEYADKLITFIDTPGHAAFTAMRARGAHLTDVAIIVVAADDGIMPQTREAIEHAKAAGVTIMVAINKIDLPNINLDVVKAQLQEVDLAPEEWGGETIVCAVSAETGEGIDQLLEMLLLQAEMMELTANPNRRATGYVIEAKLEPGMGPTANVLVTRGTLAVGDAMVCGPYWGRVKALINDQGIKVRTAGPSIPVKCLGLTAVPDAGATFQVHKNDKDAKSEAEGRHDEKRIEDLGAPARKVSLDDLFNQTNVTEIKELPVVLKTDVQGSLEAIQHSLGQIKSDKVTIKFVMASVGNITENDILLASASSAIVLGFHVSKDGKASSVSKREGIEIRLYNVIYELIEDVEKAMLGLLKPVRHEDITGHAEVKQVFSLSKRGKVAGCMVIDGRVNSKARARVKRGSDVIYEGNVGTLKRFQNDANEVRDGQECGIGLGTFSDFAAGDIIELYEVKELAQQL